ncbi:polysaccharide pyruvyl transferase family protein [Streptococcus pluranimalium]|uniref:Polysaccharide pyruvyl transferase domain-containing protein n=1 Tax=Streptococcus pluranimalium TaxID=82348 RepID=A0A345VM63_9STRE|nr:polysaccharide pyruvyl transferase family protein [Streptococcus pluranimalium]AXJ13815.1 hypothetical protein Sp14A_19270 [Streptococcus pluranimalium]
MTKFALFTYNTGNIGDDIQSLAARRFLPRVDYMINRDFMNDFVADTDEKIKLIMNGWYSHQPKNFPLVNKQIEPLVTSVYIDDSVKQDFASAENQAFFKRFSPIGARSADTQRYFTDQGIDSYLSSCLTLTLKRDPKIKKGDFILALDVPNEVFDKVQRESKVPVIRMSADVIHRYMGGERRLKVAEYYLYLYQSAQFVITTRLHGTLPCLALETPVLNLEVEGFEPGRFEGLRELAHHMTVSEFLTSDFDVNNPPKNPKAYRTVRQQLVRRCKAFTGFDDQRGFLQGKSIEGLFSDPDLIQSLVTGLWSGQQYWGVVKYK